MIRSVTMFVWVVVALTPGLSHADYGRRVEGTVVKGRTDEVLSKVQWHRDRDEALAAAKKEGKPLLWLQMVGDLDGGL